MSDQQAAWNSIQYDLDRVIACVEGMLLSPAFKKKRALEIAKFNLNAARDDLIIACALEVEGEE